VLEAAFDPPDIHVVPWTGDAPCHERRAAKGKVAAAQLGRESLCGRPRIPDNRKIDVAGD
jgi:hypothetical protein